MVGEEFLNQITDIEGYRPEGKIPSSKEKLSLISQVSE